MDGILARMEDPAESHAAPPRKDAQLMPPPTHLPTHRIAGRKRKVLEEEEYVDMLSRIIERDYFPQLAASRPAGEEMLADKDMSVTSFFEQFTSYDNDSFDTLQDESIAAHRRKFHWMYELTDGEEEKKRQPGMLMLYYLGNHVLTAQQREQMDAILEGAKEESVGDHRPNGAIPGRFRVRNQLMFPPELAVSEDICGMNANGSGGAENNGVVRSALPALTHGTPGTLLLENGGLNSSSNNIAALQRAVARYNHRVGAGSDGHGGPLRGEKTIVRSNTSFLAATIEDLAGSSSLLTAAQLHAWERSSRAQRHAISGLGGGPKGGLGLEEPHTPSLRSSADASSETSSAAGHRGTRPYTVVPMSPCPEPGQGALGSLTPLFTWGDVEESPLLLGRAAAPPGALGLSARMAAAAPGRGGAENAALQSYRRDLQAQALREEEDGAPRFALRPASRREELGRKLGEGSSGSSTQGGVGGRKSAHSSVRRSAGPAGSSRTGPDTGTSTPAGAFTPGAGSVAGSVSSVGQGSRRTSRHPPGPTSTSSVSTSAGTAVGSRAQRLASLTPAARALAEKLSGKTSARQASIL